MSKLVLGLDIGISSVGWGIIDIEDSSIVDAGVRIFSEGTTSLNEERRNCRSSRRLIRRRHHRIERIKKLLIKHEIINDSFISLDNPYEIRKKGLKEKLSKEELATVILHITKRRGVSGNWVISDDDTKIKEDERNKSTLSKNNSLLKDKYICEIQLERLNDGKTRGEFNLFPTADYIKELKQIFKNQDLENNIENEIINIIESKREYYEGPGSEKSPTKYGRFRMDNGQLIEIDLIEVMRGKCSIYPDEPRAPKLSYTADLFNILNDLNNLEVQGEKISEETKLEIIEKINIEGKISVKGLCKLLGVKENDIIGFRVDKSDKPILTEFKGYNRVLKVVKDNKLSAIICEDKELFDKIIEILTTKKGFEERITTLSIFSELSENDKKKLSELSGISEYHSLSLKVMKEVIPDLIATNDNQMQIFQKNGYFENTKKTFEGKKIPFNNDLILSAVAKRSNKNC